MIDMIPALLEHQAGLVAVTLSGIVVAVVAIKCTSNNEDEENSNDGL